MTEIEELEDEISKLEKELEDKKNELKEKRTTVRVYMHGDSTIGECMLEDNLTEEQATEVCGAQYEVELEYNFITKKLKVIE